MTALFDGVRILEFSWFGAGPIAAKWFADLGANVVRVESVVRPDALRFALPRPPQSPDDPNASGYFNNFNSSKRSITLEMGQPDGPAVAKRLIDWCDVVLENFRPSVMARWGLDYATVSAGHPELIYVAMPAVGREGPRANYAGFGTGIKMISGLAMLSGRPDEVPVGPPGAFPDYVINCGHGGTAIITALLHRQATGRGQFIEVAQMESTIAVTDTAILEATVNGRAAERLGNRHALHCPHGVFRCAGDDEWVAVAVTSQSEWEALARAIGRADWLNDDRLGTLPERRRQADELETGIEEWSSSLSAREAESVLREARGAGGEVAVEPGSAGGRRASARTRLLLDAGPPGRRGPSSYDGAPFRLSETPAEGFRPAPLLGQHTLEVYREVGFGDEEIAELVAAGVISA